MEFIVHRAWKARTPAFYERKELWHEDVAPITLYLDGVPPLEIFAKLGGQITGRDAPSLLLTFGYAACHPLDDFSRKTGRALAKSKALPTKFQIIDLWISKRFARVTLRATESNTIIRLRYGEHKSRPLVSIDSVNGLKHPDYYRTFFGLETGGEKDE